MKESITLNELTAMRWKKNYNRTITMEKLENFMRLLEGDWRLNQKKVDYCWAFQLLRQIIDREYFKDKK